MKLLNEIQQKLKCKKGQENSFGGYKYRSCSDILEAVKPLLGDACLLIEDEMVQLGDRYYVKATVNLKNGDEVVTATAYAREQATRKGMDESQITGAASSYARKYALNGLFCIDDTDDADSMSGDETAKPIEIPKPSVPQKACLKAICDALIDTASDAGKTVDEKKVQGVVYALKSSYPDDVEKAGAIAAYLLNNGGIERLVK